MSEWPATRAGVVLRALERKGWSTKPQRGSHGVLEPEGWPDYVFAFHDGTEIGPVMLRRIARDTGLQREDL